MIVELVVIMLFGGLSLGHETGCLEPTYRFGLGNDCCLPHLDRFVEVGYLSWFSNQAMAWMIEERSFDLNACI
jgi:hypothetical protein